MQNRRKSTLARTHIRWLLPLWGIGAGCFIDLPERPTDAGPDELAPDILFGTAPGDTPEGPGTKPPRTRDPDQGVSGVGPPPPVPEPPSEEPPDPPEPPTMAPTAAPTEPPMGCVADVCHTCDGDTVVPMMRDARCEFTDCDGFLLYGSGVDPATGLELCNVFPSQMPSDCDAEGHCRVASAETCTEPVGAGAPIYYGTPCQHVVDCRTGAFGTLELVAQGQPCIGRPGVCDQFGRCVDDPGGPVGEHGAEICEHLRLTETFAGGQQTFCEAQPGEPAVCRFAIQLGTAEADPRPWDFNLEASCGHFCSRYGWTCVAALENDDQNQCALRDQAIAGALIENGCDRTVELDFNDGVDARNGILCDCRLH